MAISESKLKTDELPSELSLYEDLCSVSEKMMKAAEKGDWDEMLLHEKSHQELNSHLKGMDGTQQLGPKELDRKADLIGKILSIDKQTQSLIKERMDMLQKNYNNELKIAQSYGSQAG